MNGRSTKAILAVGAALPALLGAASALAQVTPGMALERDAARMEVESLRQDQMAAARRAQAARDRAVVGSTLQGLATARDPASPRQLQSPPERGGPAAALSLRLDELDRLTDARLARSNAAIRAVKPASER